ncbi:hypothetical protein WK55_22110 [Burkholderia ubonensis]|uniref:PrgH/EprH family type III secretion apparatus protein n=1 Tax=Burkholderia ubonensis TaxID=101571 RepID=UPI00076BEC11|nr:PrgH/EprH family type III secretion apparatus protein [Burkholderia ubonensis]KVT54031.1 hypothetical protein WK55_22110 [Burkholderia ubonensis]
MLAQLAPDNLSHDADTTSIQAHPHGATEGNVYELRILFGPLFGVDIRLPGNDVFLHVGNDVSGAAPSEDGTTSALSLATNVLYLPYPGQADHFRLRLSTNSVGPDDGSEPYWDGHHVEFVGGDHVECQTFRHNAPLQRGVVAFAVKRALEPWSDEVRNFVPRAESEALAPPPVSLPPVSPALSRAHFGWAWLCMGALLIVSLTGLGYWQLHRYIMSQHVADVAGLLARAPAPNAILPGRDGFIHVISGTDDGADWDRQALLKASSIERVQVTSLAQERRQLERQLTAHGISFATVRLSTPATPILVVVDNGNAGPDVPRLAHQLQQLAPYATTPQVRVVSRRDIEQSARTMLDAIDVHYRVTPRPHGVTFELLGTPTDTQLAALQDHVLQFSRTWGTREVNFDIAMRPNRLNGKSYWDGDGHYILVHPDSWYFPQPLHGAM